MITCVSANNLVTPEMSSSVKDAIAKLKEESKELGVERELFLTGNIEKRRVSLEGAIAGSSLYQRGLIISPTQDLSEDQYARFTEAAEYVSKRPNLGVLNFLQNRGIKKYFKDLPVKFLLETSDGQREIEIEQIPSIQAQAVYFPSGIIGVSITSDTNYDFFERLTQEQVVGHFHTHPQIDDHLMIGSSDIYMMNALKALIDQKRIVAGIGNVSHGENFYLF